MSLKQERDPRAPFFSICSLIGLRIRVTSPVDSEFRIPADG